MSDFDIGLVIIAANVLLLVVIVGLGAFVINQQLRAEHKRGDELAQQMLLVRQSISGLTAGTVGMDRRLSVLETREKQLTERQETIEIQHVDDQPYGHAIRLVQKGAAARRLVDELALSESEADLIVRLHGQRDSA